MAHLIRAFPLSEKMVEPDGFEKFFLEVLPFRRSDGQQAGRFNLHKSVNLNGSPAGTVVLFFPFGSVQAVTACARLAASDSGPHFGPDALSEPNSIGYFLVDPESIVFLGQPINREKLPWWFRERRAMDGKHKVRRLNFRECLAWSIEAVEDEQKRLLDMLEQHDPRRPRFQGSSTSGSSR